MLHGRWTATYVLQTASKDRCWLRSLMGLIWQMVLCVSREAISQNTLRLHQNTAANKQEEAVDVDLGRSRSRECGRASAGQCREETQAETAASPGRRSGSDSCRLRAVFSQIRPASEHLSQSSSDCESLAWILLETWLAWVMGWYSACFLLHNLNVGGKNFKTFRR